MVVGGFDWLSGKSTWSSYSWYVISADWQCNSGTKLLRVAMASGEFQETIAGIFEAQAKFGKLNPASYHPAGWWIGRKGICVLLQDKQNAFERMRETFILKWIGGVLHFSFMKGLSSRWHIRTLLWLIRLLGSRQMVALNFSYRWNWEKKSPVYAGERGVGWNYYWNRLAVTKLLERSYRFSIQRIKDHLYGPTKFWEEWQSHRYLDGSKGMIWENSVITVRNISSSWLRQSEELMQTRNFLL